MSDLVRRVGSWFNRLKHFGHAEAVLKYPEEALLIKVASSSSYRGFMSSGEPKLLSPEDEFSDLVEGQYIIHPIVLLIPLEQIDHEDLKAALRQLYGNIAVRGVRPSWVQLTTSALEVILPTDTVDERTRSIVDAAVQNELTATTVGTALRKFIRLQSS